MSQDIKTGIVPKGTKIEFETKISKSKKMNVDEIVKAFLESKAEYYVMPVEMKTRNEMYKALSTLKKIKGLENISFAIIKGTKATAISSGKKHIKYETGRFAIFLVRNGIEKLPRYPVV